MATPVVITGIGVVSALGTGIDALWTGLLQGRSGIVPVDDPLVQGFPCAYWAPARDVAARDYLPKSYRKAIKVMARDTELAVVAAALAVRDAALVTRADAQNEPTIPPNRLGCSIGAGLIAAETVELTSAMVTSTDAGGAFSVRRWGTIPPGDGGMSNLPPLWLLKYLPNMPACHVSIIHGAEGPSNTITCNEASGLLSIGESMRLIERGSADACFAGGTESKLNPMGFLRMHFARRLGDTSACSDPRAAVRPYDPTAPGTVLGEGAGILILEHHGSASARGATPIASLLGFGAGQSLTSDPPGENHGLLAAIHAALRDADLSPDAIDAVVPQACGAPTIDAGEAWALRRVFGDRIGEVPIITICPNVGHAAAGHGAIQVAVAARAIAQGCIPARLHAGGHPDDLQVHSAPAAKATLRHVLVCTSALGGQNAAVVLGQVA